MKSRISKKTWYNDEATAPRMFFFASRDVVNSDSDSDSDDYQDIPDAPTEDKESMQAQLRGTAEESSSDSESDDEELSNQKGRTAMKLMNDPNLVPNPQQEPSNQNDDEDDVIEEGRLFVSNIPYTCSEEELSAYMSQFGEVTDVFIPLDKERKGKGYGFVTFMFPEKAIAAIEVSLHFPLSLESRSKCLPRTRPPSLHREDQERDACSNRWEFHRRFTQSTARTRTKERNTWRGAWRRRTTRARGTRCTSTATR